MRIAFAAGTITALLIGTSGTLSAQFTTPGTVVGTPLSMGGSSPAPSNPAVGAPVGNQVGNGLGGMSPTNSQDFSKINRDQLAAPLPTYPGIGGSPTLWDRAKQKVISATSIFSSTPSMNVSRPTWVPGISRRNRERAEERRWQRD